MVINDFKTWKLQLNEPWWCSILDFYVKVFLQLFWLENKGLDWSTTNSLVDLVDHAYSRHLLSTVDWPLIDTQSISQCLIDTRLLILDWQLNQHPIDSGSIVGWMLTDSYVSIDIWQCLRKLQRYVSKETVESGAASVGSMDWGYQNWYWTVGADVLSMHDLTWVLLKKKIFFHLFLQSSDIIALVTYSRTHVSQMYRQRLCVANRVT